MHFNPIAMAIALLESRMPPSPSAIAEVDPSGQKTENLITPGLQVHRTLRTLFDQRRSRADRKDAKRPTGVGRVDHVKAGIKTAVLWDVEKRGANGQDKLIRAKDAHNPDSYGAILEAAAEDPQLSDHNYSHVRRVKRFTEALLHNIGEIRHGQYLEKYLPAVASFAQRHDVVQLLRQYENKYMREGERKLSTKFTHATGGAIMELLEAEEYAKAAGKSPEEAKQIKRASAFMIMKHDKPAHLAKALSGTDDAQQLAGKDLVDSFKSNTLDLTTLSPAQLLYIHREIASEQEGFVTEHTPHGLPRVVEDYFADRLAILANDTEPILPGIQKDERQTLNVMTEISVVADVMDMIIPPEESLMRKFLVPLNEHLPFFRADLPNHTLKEQIFGDEGTPSADEASMAVRALWEYVHILEIFPKGVVSESPYAQRVIGKAVLQGCMALENIGTYIMAGKELQDENSPIWNVYARRIKHAGEKALRRAETPRRAIRQTSALPVSIEAGEFEESVGNYLHRENDINERFGEKAAHLRDEYREIVNIARKKQVRADGTSYEADDLFRFKQVVREVSRTLCDRYGISATDRWRFRRELQRGEYTAPFRSYDYLAEPIKARTIYPTMDLIA